MKLRNLVRFSAIPAFLASGAAMAIDSSGAVTAVSDAGGEAATLGGAVVLAVAAIAGVGLILHLVRKV